MNYATNDVQDGVARLLDLANQIRCNAQRMLDEASAFEELRHLLHENELARRAVAHSQTIRQLHPRARRLAY